MALVYTKKEKRNIWIRVILLVILLIIIVACVVVIANQFKTKKGLKTITADSSTHLAESKNFELKYYIDKDKNHSLNENFNIIKKYYADTFDKIYELVEYKDEYDKNIYYINHHLNEVIEVDQVLYKYLKKIYDFDSKYLFLGPVYDFWFDRIYITDRIQALLLDPYNNSEIQTSINYFMTTSINSISIDFLDDNKIKLNVSEDYKPIVEEEDICYINFSIFTNAIILDYISYEFDLEGFTNGFFSSNDGFGVNLGYDGLVAHLKSKEYKNGFYKLDMKEYSSIIQTYNYNYDNNYPYYEIENNKRSLYINSSTGYSYDLLSGAFYNKSSIVDLLMNVLNYYNDNSSNDYKYIIQKDNKIYTNDEIESSLEVIYEN